MQPAFKQVAVVGPFARETTAACLKAGSGNPPRSAPLLEPQHEPPVEHERLVALALGAWVLNAVDDQIAIEL